ncbi:MAG: hypothetical protein HY015_01070 [Bacteroidetes bacterium]|nr:hypothetical protein [Bacteroidota bacterium]MBI3481569.1 hypothetical protein [Bacteroidota bacterium]
MKTKTVLMIGLVQIACGVSKTYLTFPDWDSNSDKQIRRNEFVDAYGNLNYFNKWSHGKGSISYADFYPAVFESMDRDQNKLITSDEFNSQIKLFFFGMFNGDFGKWDDDKSGSIILNEFVKHIGASKFASLWDDNSDTWIENHEMAGGMFYVCDVNNNGSVDEIELNNWKKNR